MSLVLSVTGRSNSGKTSLLERLIAELRKRRFTVAAVKHSGDDLQLGHPGKGSWRLTEAGSNALVLVSPHRLTCMKWATHPPILEDSSAGRPVILQEAGASREEEA